MAAKIKPVTPYQRLLEAAQKFAREVVYPKKAVSMSFRRERIMSGEAYELRDLLQRVIAADQLGYCAEIRIDQDHLHVYLVQRRPTDTPWEFR